MFPPQLAATQVKLLEYYDEEEPLNSRCTMGIQGYVSPMGSERKFINVGG